MKPKITHDNPQSLLTLACPACGQAIPITKAVEQLVAQRTSDFQASAVQSAAKLQELENALETAQLDHRQELEHRVLDEHARMEKSATARLDRLREEHQLSLEQLAEQYQEERKAEVTRLKQRIEAATQAAEAKYPDGLAEGQASASKTQHALQQTQRQLATARQDLASMSRSLEEVRLKSGLAFEHGKQEALKQAHAQVQEFRSLLDKERAGGSCT